MSRNMDDNKKQLPHENEVSQGKCISTDFTGDCETVCLPDYYEQIKQLWLHVKPVSEKTQDIIHPARIDSKENPLEPNLLGYCFCAILGFDVQYRPFEKINYQIGFEYKGIYAFASHRKMGYSIEINENAKEEFVEILKKTKLILNHLFQYLAKDSIQKNQFTLQNHYRQYKDKLEYDEEKIDRLYELEKNYEKECLFSFLEDCENTSKIHESLGWVPNKEWRQLIYEIEGYISDYYSYLEHLLTLLIPFSLKYKMTKSYREVWNKSWIQKLEMIWDKGSLDPKLLEDLKKYKEIYRNRFAHGMFSRETRAYVQIPKLGRYLMGIGDHYLKGFLEDSAAYLSMDTYQEMRKIYRQFEEFVYNTYPIAMVFIESGLDISVDIRQKIGSICTVEEAKNTVNKEFFHKEMVANMDW